MAWLDLGLSNQYVQGIKIFLRGLRSNAAPVENEDVTNKEYVDGQILAVTEDFDAHVDDTTIHFTQAEIDIIAAQISDFATAADARITAQKGAINGIATLSAAGVIPNAQLPALAITDTFVVNTQAAMLALACEKGDVAVRTDQNKSYILSGDDPTVLVNWQELLTPTDAVTSVNGHIGVVSLTYADVGAADVAHNHSGVYEPAITKGTTAQYFKGNMTLGTLNQAAVAGLATSDIVTHAGLIITKTGNAGAQAIAINNSSTYIADNSYATGQYCNMTTGSNDGYVVCYEMTVTDNGSNNQTNYGIRQLGNIEYNKFIGTCEFGGAIYMNAQNIQIDTATGMKIGTATNQKVGFHNATPTIQRVGAAQAAVVTTASTQTTPYGYSTQAQADAIVTLLNEIRAALVEKGIIKGSA